MIEAENSWELLLAQIQQMVTRITYRTWFEAISLQSDDGQTLRVNVPNELFRAWFEQRYGSVVHEALAQLGRAHTRVLYIPAAL